MNITLAYSSHKNRSLDYTKSRDTTHNIKRGVKFQCLQEVLSTIDILTFILVANLEFDKTVTPFPYHSRSLTFFFILLLLLFTLT